MKETILEVHGLCKCFSSEGVQNHVLSNVDLTIYKGDFTVVMGASGSGKSTLLYALSGMDRPTSGKVIYNGADIAGMSEKKLAGLRQKDFGFVFQQSHLVSNLTLAENIAVPGYLCGKYTNAEVKRRTRELLERMNISAVGGSMPIRTSGGEQQRCAIARAVIHSPEILFADEPTGALNRAGSVNVLDLLGELNRDGQSILMVTHDSEAALRGNRVLYIEDGKIVGQLDLPPYDGNCVESRRTQLSAWLSSLKW